MLFICILLSKYRRRKDMTNSELRSIKFKWRSLIINVTSFAIAAYCFLRHNRLCEPYGKLVFTSFIIKSNPANKII